MGDHNAIKNVGETLIDLFWDNIKDDLEIKNIISGENQISLLSPKDMESDASKKLSLYLYRVTEYHYLKNVDMPIENHEKLRGPPLYLTLHYLITPNTADSESDHILLGKIMQILHDNAIIRGSILKGSLADSGEELRIILEPLSIDDIQKIWTIMDRPYKLSVSYMINPVSIVSLREREIVRVVEKRDEYMAVRRKE